MRKHIVLWLLTTLNAPMTLCQLLGGLLGGVAGGALSLIGAQQQNEQSAQNAVQQEQYQSQMSNTAHQRDVADLKAAGLNPILSANAGSSTPNGAMAPVQNALGQGVQSANQAMTLANDMRGTNADITLKQAQGGAAVAAAMRDTATAKQSGVQTQAIQSQLDAIAQKAKTDVMQSGWDQKAMKYDNISKRINQGLQIGNSAKDLINPLGFGKVINKGTSTTHTDGNGEITGNTITTPN